MKDRVVQFPNRYRLTNVGGDVYDLIPQPGIVTEEGSDINKANLLPDDVAAALGLTGNPQVKDAFMALNTTARFVIGTSTAGWTAADCDYLCDGTADQTEINAAITALPAAGGEIVILDGTYNIAAKIDVIKNNVSIRGNGNATILKRMYDSSARGGVITLTSRSGCKIADLQVDGNKTSYSNNNNYGIYLDSSSDNTITGNTCYANNNYGIYLDSSSDNTITGNTCNDNSRGIYLVSSSNNTVTSNTCNNNSYGIRLVSSSSNNTITGNTCNNNNDGIYLVSSSSNNTITGNTCNTNDYGIYLDASSDNTITGNTCYANNNYGIYLSSASNSNTVTGNTCNNNQSNGIRLVSSSNNTVTGNTCCNNNRGINLSSSSNNTVTCNTCYNNSSRGINLSSSSNNTVTGNTCCNNGSGVRLESSSNNTVTGNTCNNNGSGIYLEASSNNTITGNTCIRGTGQSSDYPVDRYTIMLYGTSNNYNLISSNNCMGKSVVTEGGTSNTEVNNKWQ